MDERSVVILDMERIHKVVFNNGHPGIPLLLLLTPAAATTAQQAGQRQEDELCLNSRNSY